MTIEIALAGNPNSGKTTLFNLLTASNQRVGNWPGVTVERKSGFAKKNKQVEVQDLPGIYSMSPYTSEEIVARDYLLSHQAHSILNVVDATNLERNLYLTLQLIETGIPLVLALNMSDILKNQGKIINISKLSYFLGVPVVATSAVKNEGVDKALKKAIAVTEDAISFPVYDKHFEASIAEIVDVLGNTVPAASARFYAIKLFEQDEAIWQSLDLSSFQKKEIAEIIKITEEIFTEDAESIVVNQRYQFIEHLIRMTQSQGDDFKLKVSDRIDQVVTNRFLALPIFAFVMWVVYYLSIQTVGTMGTDWVNDVLFGQWIPDTVAAFLNALKVEAWLQDLILNGIIAGCGAVLGFLPQIIVLFLCLGILEDVGYMSRVAFVMDRIFRRFGLSGKSFIPMLIATGCGVPGIMASRTIENERDRRITIMTTTFMPCSAKLPIISLVAGAFFPKNPWIAPSAYFLGIATIVLSGMALKKTKRLGGAASPFIMELPSYHLPKMKSVSRYALDKGISFVKRAGTIIFVTNIFIWFTTSYNIFLQMVSPDKSILASLGRWLAVLFSPLGFGDWRATVAAITGLLAKETVISTLGILYHSGAEVTETSKSLWAPLQASYTPLAAYSFLVFNLLCAPCFASIGAIRREMNSLRWTMMAVFFQTGLAYGVSLLIYQFGLIYFYKQTVGIWTWVAVAVLAVFLYFVFRKAPAEKVAVIRLEDLQQKQAL
ncbi:ferrous iron transport protein B [Streptococcus ferus]|uniref:Ferrous iron transport protein B n=1 Tax=Streptococcus ferus TaxID=1345 RepID=A0A2X3XZ22_9STRE|nr:ferrous iron transport protein B [Streptococcus ferus]SQF39702.1 ferrous iron transport protein B [Streptococcus ferus]